MSLIVKIGIMGLGLLIILWILMSAIKYSKELKGGK